MAFNRRQFLARGAGVVGAAALVGCGNSVETLTAGTGGGGSAPGPRTRDYTLRAQLAENTLGTQQVTTTTYNGALCGPVLRVRQGERLRVQLINDLPAINAQGENIPSLPYVTNLHTHGLHVSPKAPSDDIFLEIAPGEEFTYIYDIPFTQPSGTLFYHPHRHGSVANQMWGGMGGALIIEGEIDEVPEIKAAREEVFVIGEVRVDSEGQQPPFTANFVTYLQAAPAVYPINGKLAPEYFARPGEVVRFRVVHSGVGNYINLNVTEHDMHVYSYDGITIEELESESNVVLAPSNRVDFLLRAGAPGTYQIKSLPYDQGFGPNPEVVLATFVVAGEPMEMGLPTTLPAPFTHIEESEITNRRTLTFDVGPSSAEQPVATFKINDQMFSDERVDQYVELGSVEEWTIHNTSDEDHPFHIHVNDFEVVQIGDTVLDRPRWHDTFTLPPNSFIKFRTRFEEFPGRYVLHCHILFHECIGMMQVVDVVPQTMTRLERSLRVMVSQGLIEKMNSSAIAATAENCAPPPSMQFRWGGPRPRREA